MTKERLNEPFIEFDSFDPKMERIPNDLNDAKIRNEYINNHKKWFLRNHKEASEHFDSEVQKKYKHKKSDNRSLF